MADLKAKQEAARKEVEELGKSTGEAWERVEKGAQAAWDDLQKAFQEASKEF
jgi:translation initiation factor 2 alpha subunit (eIF-2alpha)